MDAKTIGLAVAGVVAAGVIAAGGAAVANSTSSSSTTASSSQTGQTGQAGQTARGATGPQGGMPALPGGGQGTEVTGDEATQVKDAVAGQDSSLTVDHVIKLTDGSYLTLAMKDGAPVMYTVSADLATVTEQQAPTGSPGAGGAAGNGGSAPQLPNATATT